MASRAAKNQLLTVALVEGFVDMLWDQKYRDMPRNKTFAELRQKIKDSCSAAFKAIEAVTRIEDDDIFVLKGKIEEFKNTTFVDGFMPMDCIGLLIDLVCEQLVFCAPGSEKHDAFNSIWRVLIKLDHHFDRNRKYESDIGMQAGEAFRKVMNNECSRTQI